jgi:hypothetical protein
MTRRLRRFAHALRAHRRLWLRSPVDFHNLRALWIQSEPGWITVNSTELTDEEWAAWIEDGL